MRSRGPRAMGRREKLALRLLGKPADRRRMKLYKWQVTVREANSDQQAVADTIKISPVVGVAVPVRVCQQTLLQLEMREHGKVRVFGGLGTDHANSSANW